MIDEQVIITSSAGHQVRKTATLKEQTLAISQVASHAHIRMSAERRSQKVQSVEERIVPNQTVDMSLVFKIRTKTEHDLFAFRKTRHHRADPSVRFGHAVGICEQQKIILRRFGCQGKCQFFRRPHTRTVRNERHMQPCILRHIALHHIARVVFRTVIHHDHLVRRIILRQQRLQVVREVISFVVRTQDHTHAGHLLIGVQCTFLPLPTQLSGRRRQITGVPIHLSQRTQEQRTQQSPRYYVQAIKDQRTILSLYTCLLLPSSAFTVITHGEPFTSPGTMVISRLSN